MPADKWVEDAVADHGRHALAVVAAAHRPAAILQGGVDVQPGRAGAAVLDAVLDEVLEHQFQLREASRDGRQFVRVDDRRLIGERRPRRGQRQPQRAVQVDGLRRLVTPVELGVAEQVGDEVVGVAGHLADLVDHLQDRGGVAARDRLGSCHRCPHGDGGERIAQVVGHGVAEGGQVGIGTAEPLGHDGAFDRHAEEGRLLEEAVVPGDLGRVDGVHHGKQAQVHAPGLDGEDDGDLPRLPRLILEDAGRGERLDPDLCREDLWLSLANIRARDAEDGAVAGGGPDLGRPQA